MDKAMRGQNGTSKIPTKRIASTSNNLLHCK